MHWYSIFSSLLFYCLVIVASKDLGQTSYFLASNSLHLTTMCLQYKPTVVACFCIYLACKWSQMEVISMKVFVEFIVQLILHIWFCSFSKFQIPLSTEGKEWYYYVDKNVTINLLERLTDEFLAIWDRSPAKLKNKLSSTIKDLTTSARSVRRMCTRLIRSSNLFSNSLFFFFSSHLSSPPLIQFIWMQNIEWCAHFWFIWITASIV